VSLHWKYTHPRPDVVGHASRHLLSDKVDEADRSDSHAPDERDGAGHTKKKKKTSTRRVIGAKPLREDEEEENGPLHLDSNWTSGR